MALVVLEALTVAAAVAKARARLQPASGTVVDLASGRQRAALDGIGEVAVAASGTVSQLVALSMEELRLVAPDL